MLPILQIGPLALPVPQFSLLLAFWLGLSLAEKLAPRRGVTAETLYNLTFTGLLAGLLGARLGFVLQSPAAFIQSPLSLFSLNPGLLDPFSGAAIALLAMLVFAQRARLPFWNTLDALTPLLAVLAVGLAMAHIASGEAFGTLTDLPWGIQLWGATRHPAQFYELIAALLILLLLGWRSRAAAPAGTLFLTGLALHAGARLFLEAFRGDSALVFGNLRIAQILAWLLLAATLAGLEIRKSASRLQKEGQNG